MKVAIMVSCSRTSRVARAQKGLMCPIRHIEWVSLQDLSDKMITLTPTWNRAKHKVRSIHRRWHRKKLGSVVDFEYVPGARLKYPPFVRWVSAFKVHGQCNVFGKKQRSRALFAISGWGIIFTQHLTKLVLIQKLEEPLDGYQISGGSE